MRSRDCLDRTRASNLVKNHPYQDIRGALSGGYCGIGIRHIKTNTLSQDEPDLIPEVTTSPCGLPYATCAGWDANSLYAHAMKQKMLCGPGSLLKLKDGKFHGEFMGSKSNGMTQFSFVRDLNFVRFKCCKIC